MNKFIERVHRITYLIVVRRFFFAAQEIQVNSNLKVVPADEAASVASELRQLVGDMLEVSADGRKLAADLAQSIREIVTLQCDAIDARARLILAKAEALSAKE